MTSAKILVLSKKINSPWLEWVLNFITDSWTLLETETKCQSYLSIQTPDLIILDLEFHLPENNIPAVETEVAFLRSLTTTEALKKVPFIVYGDQRTPFTKMSCYLLGVYDFITPTKSNPKELIARISAVLTHTKSERNTNYSLNGIHIDIEKHIATNDGKAINLKPIEFKLLSYLVRNSCKALSRNKILENIQDDFYSVEERSVDVHIAKLRKKLGKKSVYIKTIQGIGYKFEEEQIQ